MTKADDGYTTSNDKSNVIPLRRASKVTRKSTAKRGRPPERTLMALFQLRAEVDAHVAEIKEKNPKRIRGPLKEAIDRCLKRDNETQPRSWWWGVDGKPLAYKEAAQLYHHAVRVVLKKEEDEANGKPDDWHFPSLASLGAGLPPEPVQTFEQRFEALLRDKQDLYRRDDGMIPRSRLLALKRDFQRLELRTIAFYKRKAEEMHLILARDAPKRPPEQVDRFRAFLKTSDGHLADFVVKLRKIGTPNGNIRSLK